MLAPVKPVDHNTDIQKALTFDMTCDAMYETISLRRELARVPEWLGPGGCSLVREPDQVLYVYR